MICARPDPLHDPRPGAHSTCDVRLRHLVTVGDAGYIQEIFGPHIISFIYLGAKHMITGYDHILFILGVFFFPYHMKDVVIHVSIFAVGLSVTMIVGVWFGWRNNAYKGTQTALQYPPRTETT